MDKWSSARPNSKYCQQHQPSGRSNVSESLQQSTSRWKEQKEWVTQYFKPYECRLGVGNTFWAVQVLFQRFTSESVPRISLKTTQFCGKQVAAVLQRKHGCLWFVSLPRDSAQKARILSLSMWYRWSRHWRRAKTEKSGKPPTSSPGPSPRRFSKWRIVGRRRRPWPMLN